jgi:small-conductance mechanosensitive channel
MRSSDRFLAITLAVMVWLFAGYAVVSRTVSPRVVKTSAFDATAAVGLAIGRP